MCPPFLSLLVSALFHWSCSISIHLSPRFGACTAGVRPFPLAMQHFLTFVSQVISLLLSSRFGACAARVRPFRWPCSISMPCSGTACPPCVRLVSLCLPSCWSLRPPCLPSVSLCLQKNIGVRRVLQVKLNQLQIQQEKHATLYDVVIESLSQYDEANLFVVSLFCTLHFVNFCSSNHSFSFGHFFNVQSTHTNGVFLQEHGHPKQISPKPLLVEPSFADLPTRTPKPDMFPTYIRTISQHPRLEDFHTQPTTSGDLAHRGFSAEASASPKILHRLRAPERERRRYEDRMVVASKSFSGRTDTLGFQVPPEKVSGPWHPP